MPDTTYSIELQGLNLPEGAKEKIEASLRSAVMKEIAALDIDDKVRVDPLPAGERSIFGSLGPVLGFIIRNMATVKPVIRSSERSSNGATATLPFHWAPSDGVEFPPFGTESTTDLLESLYLRPDVRMAVISNSRAFAELLSRDEDASRVFREIVGGMDGTPDESERFLPVVIWAVVAGSSAAGAAVGYLSRKK